MNEKEPFPGLEYFRTEDAELFFGRENETARLVARILSSAFTLLHAPSGAGKTSLLNASAIPDLEARGWSVDAEGTVVPPPSESTEDLRGPLSLRRLAAAVERALDRGWLTIDPPGSPPRGMALFPPMGTQPLQAGLVVPDDYTLPPGYTRHYQVTDDGQQLPPILKYSPDYEFFDEHVREAVTPALLRRWRDAAEGRGQRFVVMLCGVQTVTYPRARDIALMARRDGIDVLAGGVHLSAHGPSVDFLVSCGCDFIQGYLVGKPVDADAAAKEYV